MDLQVSVTIDLSDRVVDLIEGFMSEPVLPKIPNKTADLPDIPEPEIDRTIPTPPPDTAGVVELDAEGLPWDQRVHSSGRTQYATTSPKNAKDTWKLKKGVNPVLVGQVKTELRGVYPDPSGAVETLASAQTAAGLAAGPPAIPPAGPVVLPGAGTITQWGQLMTAITEAGITPEQTHAACIAQGLADVNALFSNPQTVPAVARALGLTQ